MKTKTKKLLGATLATVFSSLYFLLMIGVISFFQFTGEETMPWGFYIFLIAIFGIPLIVIIVNLIARIKEILGGEEDEASKY